MQVFNKNILRTLSALALISPIGIVGVNILGVNIGANETISIFDNDTDTEIPDQSLDLILGYYIFIGIGSISLSLSVITVLEALGRCPHHFDHGLGRFVKYFFNMLSGCFIIYLLPLYFNYLDPLVPMYEGCILSGCLFTIIRISYFCLQEFDRDGN